MKILVFFLSLIISMSILSSCASYDRKITCNPTNTEAKEDSLLREIFYLSLLPAEPVVGIVSLVTHKPFLYLNIWDNTIARGNGELVVVIPGLWTSDIAVIPMVSSLNRLGFTAYSWNQGMSLIDFKENEKSFTEYMYALFLKHDQKINLVGWSIGGARAIDFADKHPELIRSVITLGTPYRSNPLPSFLRDEFGKYVYHDVSESLSTISTSIPITAIYGLGDALVTGRNGAILEENLVDYLPRENLTVTTNHFGLGFSISVLKIVTDRLSEDSNTWRPYCRE